MWGRIVYFSRFSYIEVLCGGVLSTSQGSVTLRCCVGGWGRIVNFSRFSDIEVLCGGVLSTSQGSVTLRCCVGAYCLLLKVQ